MDNFIDYLYNLLVKYNTYFIIKQHINADTNKALSDLYSTMKERSVKELEDFCINQQNNKTPSILLEIYKRCNRFMEVNKEQYDTHRIWDNLNTSNVYEQSKAYCRLIDYYFSIDINGYQERGISTNVHKYKEQPNLIDLITIPEGSTTTKGEIIKSVQSMLKVPKDIAMIALALWEKGYVSLQKERTDIRKALFIEADKIGIEVGSESNFNSHIRNHKKGNITELKDWISKLP